MSYLSTYKNLKIEINDFHKVLDNYKSKYISTGKTEIIKEKYENNYCYLKKHHVIKIFFHKFIKEYERIDILVEKANKKFIETENKKYDTLFNNISGYPLDQKQRNAVIIDDDKNLIVAGAGSGKSLTMIGKIHYLIETKNIREDEILCISFTNEATNSLKNKLKKIFNYDIDVYTFHKLGYKIIRNINPNIKLVSEHMLRECIDSYFKSQDEQVIYKIIDYFSEFTKIPRDYKIKTFISLKTICSGIEEYINSKEEIIISNILYLKGIKYKYEKTEYGSIFHLDEEKIYYYHFNNLSYALEVIKQDNINIYKYDVYDIGLIKKIEKIIKNNNIKSFPLDKNKLYQDMIENNNDYIKSLKALLINFINVFKANTKTIECLELEVTNNTIEYAFLKIFKEIYIIYQNKLREKNAIDINDMLINATELTNKKYTYKPYKYILIDEFQDTSIVRYQLIHNIIKHTGAKLVAVGDDFQSIYRFSGCDINLFINFEKYFGKASISHIENTYRNSQELIDIAGAFVMKNPSQIKKQLRSNKHIKMPIEIHYYENNLSTVFLNLLKTLSTQKEKIILGRNNKDIELLKCDEIKINGSNVYIRENKENIPYLTIHKSKGLEYDYVFLINMKDSINGFPSKLEEHKIMKLVLPKEEEYPYAEERRLFYVALTRAKEKVFILAPKDHQSIFVKEIDSMLKMYFPQENKKSI